MKGLYDKFYDRFTIIKVKVLIYKNNNKLKDLENKKKKDVI